MLKVDFKKTEIGDDVDEIAINNIIQSDKCTRTDFFMCSMIGWLNNDKTRDFQQLETFLRKNNCNAYLISKPVLTERKNMYLTMPNNNKLEKTHELIFAFDKNEILKYNNSYDENFNKLVHAGCYAYKTNPELESDENVLAESKQDIKFDEKNFEFNLTQNSVVLTMVRMTDKETVLYVKKCLEQQLGQELIKSVVGEIVSHENEPVIVYSYTVDNKIVSDCAWTEIDENTYKMIDMRNAKVEVDK